MAGGAPPTSAGVADPGQPGETIAIPINTGEQSYLALPTGEGHEPSMDMQLPHAFSEPMASHCETGLVSRGLRGLLAAFAGFSQPGRRASRAPVRGASGSGGLRTPRPVPRRQPSAA